MMQSNPQLLEVFSNPTVPYDQKRKVLSALITRTRLRPTTGERAGCGIGRGETLSVQTVARRYAAALADVVTARGESREVRDELMAWETMMQSNPQLLEVFSNPTVPYDQKRKVLSALITRTRLRPTTANFLQVLLQNQRLAELGEVNKRFAQVMDERSGLVTAAVTTARPVGEDSREALRAKLSEITGKRVNLSFSTDEDLIGGIIARIGSTIYDGSVRNQLEQVKERLSGKS
jgi:F-type H+-transporting ATPase subunit delta